MNLLAPVSSIMNTDIHIVLPDDNINLIKDIIKTLAKDKVMNLDYHFI